MIGAAVALTAMIVVYGGYSAGIAKISAAIAALVGDAFEGGPEGAAGARIRPIARALRPGGDRRVDNADAVREPLCGRALDSAVASPWQTMAGPADLAQPSLAARRR